MSSPAAAAVASDSAATAIHAEEKSQSDQAAATEERPLAFVTFNATYDAYTGPPIPFGFSDVADMRASHEPDDAEDDDEGSDDASTTRFFYTPREVLAQRRGDQFATIKYRVASELQKNLRVMVYIGGKTTSFVDFGGVQEYVTASEAREILASLSRHGWRIINSENKLTGGTEYAIGFPDDM
jgi:hypothetical protein